jgi:hypothetical protein
VSETTVIYVGCIDGLDVSEVYKDGVLIGRNASVPDDAEQSFEEPNPN